MDLKRRTNLAAGLVLILIGGAFLVAQLVPDAFAWLDPATNWPLFIIGIGVLLLLVGLLAGIPAMAVPACIVGGIGGLLYWQNATGNWESWAYVWTLIPGFVGIGVILSGLLSGQPRKAIREGGGSIFISLVLFTIFGFFFGRDAFQGILWPSLLIALGVLVLIRGVFRLR
ncbi:MAG: hypothetical protein GTO40_02505 [Deltaproteobacteria bacterium]|nr:hypothetical protein [Deltaproteobacteria bacterium]